MCTSRSRGSTSASCFSPLIESFTSMSALLRLSLSALDGPPQSAGRQHAHEISLVLHGAAQVFGGLGRLGGKLGGALDRRLVGRLALECRLRLRRLDGREAHVGEADAHLIASAVRAERE